MGGEHAVLDEGDVSAMIQGKHTILMPCTFATASERTAAQRIVPQFADNQDITLLMAYVPDSEEQETPDDIDTVMDRLAAMWALRVDEVITLPCFDPNSLRGAIFSARRMLEMQYLEVQQTFEAEPKCMQPEDREALQAQYDNLMWSDIPRALMPHFPMENPDLLEGAREVGSYRCLHVFPTPSRSIVHAVCDATAIEYAIKVVDKSMVVTPADLECVYREYRFLSTLSHPNVCHCHEMLHSETTFYIVLEYAGSRNLAQILAGLPGQRLGVYEAIDCFRQLARGLAHCHEKSVVHRSVCPQNLVAGPREPRGWARRWRLVDFAMAVQSCQGQMSWTVCGTLPCVAPEAALGGPYLPRPADCWSMGVVLLEAAGGVSSLSRSVPFDPEGEPELAVSRIRDFFNADGSHAVALAHLHNVYDEDLIRMLQMVLASAPSDRHEASDCLNSLPACSQQHEAAAAAVVAPT